MTDKQRLRADMRAVRSQLEDRVERSRLICEKAAAEAERTGAKNVLSYFPVRGEVDIAPLNEYLIGHGFCLYLPKMLGPAEMIACRVSDLDSLKPGAFGIPEPDISADAGCDLAFVPLMAFDRAGYRLGQGLGCYDRYLASRRIRTVGIAFSCQLAETVFPEAHDIPLDKIITESFELE